MIAALDVQYAEDGATAIAAAVVFQNWTDEAPLAEYAAVCERIQSYVPGEFYKRELPCLLAVLERVSQPLEAIIIDGYVLLGDKPGLGMRLWEAMDRKRPIIGVAKTHFRGAAAAEVWRGQTRIPLYVTAAGTNVTQAATNVARMAGSFRVPTMLKRVDRLARDPLRAANDPVVLEGMSPKP